MIKKKYAEEAKPNNEKKIKKNSKKFIIKIELNVFFLN
jgi:hypothetical protein